MAENKTKETAKSVIAFINKVAGEEKRDDSFRIIEMFQELSGFEPKMWGPSIVGFGTYHYKYESGREGDMPLYAFSPRSTAIVFYLGSFAKKEELLKKLGKYKGKGGCVYVKKLADIDEKVLKKLVTLSAKAFKN